MLQIDKVNRALAAVEECCGHGDLCSPDCPVAVARRALSGLAYDLGNYEPDSAGQEVCL